MPGIIVKNYPIVITMHYESTVLICLYVAPGRGASDVVMQNLKNYSSLPGSSKMSTIASNSSKYQRENVLPNIVGVAMLTAASMAHMNHQVVKTFELLENVQLQPLLVLYDRSYQYLPIGRLLTLNFGCPALLTQSNKFEMTKGHTHARFYEWCRSATTDVHELRLKSKIILTMRKRQLC